MKKSLENQPVLLSIMNKKLLKLDFNERSDKFPAWLKSNEIDAQKLWAYPDKASLSKMITQRFNLTEEQLLVTNGGDEAIELLFKLTRLQNKKLILPLPAFSQYWAGKDSWQLDAELIEANQDLTINFDAALAALESDSVLVLTSPNNPTGETLTLQQIERAAYDAQQKGAWIFLDQAYIEFTGDDQTSLKLIEQFDNIVLLRTLSKAYGLAGIRVGYLLGAAKIIQQFKSLAMPFNISSPNLEFAKQAFSDSARLEVTAYCQQVKQNRQLVTNYLRDKGLSVIDSQANFVFVQGARQKLQLIDAACRQDDIQIKSQLVGLSEVNNDIQALRITIPYYLDRLLVALQLALEPQLLCFDMDGVLINTQKSYDQCIIETVKAFTNEVVSQDKLLAVRSRGGFNNDWKLAQQIILESGYKVDFESVVAKFQSFYSGSATQQGLSEQEEPLITQAIVNRVFSGKRKALNTAVVTGRPKNEALQGLEKLNIKNTVLISDDDVELSKPDPEGINKAKKFFKAETCWMFGDAPDDMQAAKAAQVIAIGIANNDMTKDALLAAGADLIIENVNQLEVLL